MKKATIKALLSLGVIVSGLSMLTGCNTVQGTVQGAGKDIQAVTGSSSKSSCQCKKKYRHHAKKMQSNTTTNTTAMNQQQDNTTTNTMQ